jgi:hypothetical protein
MYYLILTKLRGKLFLSHFKNGETESQKNWSNLIKLLSYQTAVLFIHAKLPFA